MKLKDQAQEKIEPELPPEELNYILNAKYGYGLYQFAHCLADLIVHEYDVIDSSRALTRVEVSMKFFDDLIDKLKALKEDTLKRLIEIDQSIFFAPIAKKYNEISEYLMPELEKIMEHFNLHPYFKAVDETIKYIEGLKKSAPIKSKGRQIRARNYVILTWSYAMKRPDIKTDWIGMADLFNWFYWNLKGTEFATRLLPKKNKPEKYKGIFHPDNLKKEVYRLRKKLKNDTYLRKKVDKFKKYYFQNQSEITYWAQIDFRWAITSYNTYSSLGKLSTAGEEEGHEYDERGIEIIYSPVIIFPNGKTLKYP